MNFLLWHRGSEVAIASPRRVLRAAEVPLLADVNVLCERLQSLYSAETARLDAARKEAGESGYAAGFEEGIEAANEALAGRLAELTSSAARRHQALSDQVADLAVQVARKMIGSLAEHERLVALARTAARDLMPLGATTLFVHPDRVDAVRERLALLAAGPDADPLLQWNVQADADRDPESCRLETDFGSVDATLDTQMRRLTEAWGIASDARSAA